MSSCTAAAVRRSPRRLACAWTQPDNCASGSGEQSTTTAASFSAWPNLVRPSTFTPVNTSTVDSHGFLRYGITASPSLAGSLSAAFTRTTRCVAKTGASAAAARISAASVSSP